MDNGRWVAGVVVASDESMVDPPDAPHIYEENEGTNRGR